MGRGPAEVALATECWLRGLLVSGEPLLLVTTATVPGLRRLETTLTLLADHRDVSHCVVAILGPRLLAAPLAWVAPEHVAAWCAVVATTFTAVLAALAYRWTAGWIASTSVRLALAALVVLMPVAAMENTAVLVNTSRGPVIDEAALARALAAGELFAAGLDVFEKEPEVHPDLLEQPNAVVIPHLGSATVDTRDAMGMLAAENLFAGLEGRRPPTVLNPEVWESRQGS